MSGNRADGLHGLGKLLGNVATDIQDLVRGEVRLARLELDQKLDRVIMAAIWLLGGALVAFAGVVVILEGGAAALALVLPQWAASVIVGLAIVIIGALFARYRARHAFPQNSDARPDGCKLGKGCPRREGAHLMSDTGNPARIERDLDETRSRLGTHLSELQDRLSPGQILDDLMGYFRSSEGAAFGQNLVANVRANPMPAAITGIGLAWLMASNPRAGAVPPGSVSAAGLQHYGRENHAATMTRVQ